MAARQQDAFELHLKEGAAKPPRTHPKQLRLFTMRFCPFAERTILVLNHHRLPFESVGINLISRPAWYATDINPLGKVPAVELPDARIVFDSTIASEAVDKMFAPEGQSLIPRDPMEEARGRMVFAIVDSAFFLNYTFNPWVSAEKLVVQSEKLIERLNAAAKHVTGPFILGDKVSLYDYILFPTIERLDPLAEFAKQAVPWRSIDVWARWYDAMLTQHAVRVTALPYTDHMVYYRLMEPKATGMMQVDAFDVGLKGANKKS